MGLFNFSKKGAVKKETVKNVNSLGERLDRLTPEGELPFGWVSYNKDFIKQCESMLDNQLKNLYSAHSESEKITEYRKYFDVVNHIGEICKNKGECHYKWFEYYVISSPSYEELVKDYQKLKNKFRH